MITHELYPNTEAHTLCRNRHVMQSSAKHVFHLIACNTKTRSLFRTFGMLLNWRLLCGAFERVIVIWRRAGPSGGTTLSPSPPSFPYSNPEQVFSSLMTENFEYNRPCHRPYIATAWPADPHTSHSGPLRVLN